MFRILYDPSSGSAWLKLLVIFLCASRCLAAWFFWTVIWKGMSKFVRYSPKIANLDNNWWSGSGLTLWCVWNSFRRICLWNAGLTAVMSIRYWTISVTSWILCCIVKVSGYSSFEMPFIMSVSILSTLYCQNIIQMTWYRRYVEHNVMACLSVTSRKFPVF